MHSFFSWMAVTVWGLIYTATAPVGVPDLAAIDAQLHRGEWEAARAAAQARIDAELKSPLAVDLAGAVARLAVAEAGLSRKEDALWHWGAAQNLDAKVLSPADLAGYGPAGDLLAGRPLRQMYEPPAGMTVHRQDESGIQPGYRVKGLIPSFPPTEGYRIPPTLHIQAVIDEQGRFLAPVVLGGGTPAVNYQALEILRDWKYEPARRNLRHVATFRRVMLEFSPGGGSPGYVALAFPSPNIGGLIQQRPNSVSQGGRSPDFRNPTSRVPSSRPPVGRPPY